MASYSSTGNADNVHWNLESLLKASVTDAASDGFTATAHSGAVFVFGGHGFTFGADGLPLTGTITSLSVTGGPTAPFTVSNADLSVATLMEALQTNDPRSVSSALFSGNDHFTAHSGEVHLQGFNGSDTFDLGRSFDAQDIIDGGNGHDTIQLAAPHSAVVLSDATLTSVESMILHGKGAYDLTFADGNIADGRVLKIDAGSLFASSTVTLDDSAETDGHIVVHGGRGADTITGSLNSDRIFGGAGDDVINGGNGANVLSGGAGNDVITGGSGNDIIRTGIGIDHVSAGDGNDQIYFGGDFSTGDVVDGGAGNDTLHITETSLGTLTLLQPSIQGVETIQIDSGAGLSLSFGDHTALSGPLTINASSLTSGNALVADATNVTEGTVSMIGGAGDDVLTGGAGTNILDGGLGNNILNAGSGADTFMFDAPAIAQGATNVINGFDAAQDSLGLPSGITGLDTSLLGGLASSIQDLIGLVGNSLGGHDAMIVKPLLGLLGGDTFMMVDENGQAGFQAGQDLLIQLENATHLGQLDLGNFLG